MKKILLLYPDIPKQGLTLLPPLSLIYIATPLHKDFEINIIDQRVEKDWRSILKSELASGDIVCVGISTMTGMQISGALKAAKLIKECSPETPVVWGGVHPSLLPEQTIKNGYVDIIVIGDGEATFKELVETIEGGGNRKNVKGIIYKENGNIVRTSKRGQFPLNTLVEPAYDLVDLQCYKFTNNWTGSNSLPIITSRGCPGRCSYCYNREFSHKKWNALSAEQTFSLIETLINKYHLNNIFLLDDNFFVNLSRVKRICELLIQSKMNIGVYNANCRIDTIAKMDDEFLDLLKRAGFNQLYLGVESGSDDILKKINKDITIDQTLLVNRKLKRAGIKPFYSFMAGFIFETVNDIKKTIALMNCLLKENPDAIISRLQFYTPFPGTELFYESSRMGMKLPESLEAWAQYHYDQLNYTDFEPRQLRFLKDLQYYTNFLDTKLFTQAPRHMKLIAEFYSRLLKFRIDHQFYDHLYELYGLQGLQDTYHKWSGKEF